MSGAGRAPTRAAMDGLLLSRRHDPVVDRGNSLGSDRAKATPGRGQPRHSIPRNAMAQSAEAVEKQ